MIGRHDLTELLAADRAPPCVSVYLPTDRTFPQQQQNVVRYRNLLKEVEAGTKRPDMPPPDERVLALLRALIDDVDLWSHPADGLAVFASSGFFRVHKLPRKVRELAIVAQTFHVKPLLRMVQSADRYQVLALNRERISLYEGNRDALEESELAEQVPATIEQALGEELTEEHNLAFSYGTGPAGGAGGRRESRRHPARPGFEEGRDGCRHRALLSHH